MIFSCNFRLTIQPLYPDETSLNQSAPVGIRYTTWGRGWMTKASGVGERRKGRGELRRDCHHRVAALFVPTRMQQWYIDIWYIRRPRPSPRPGRRLGPPQVWNLPQQAPQGQGHSNGFLWAFKAAVMGFQSCRLPARKRSKPSKTFQTLQTLQDLPNPPNTVPSRHPRAKATSRTGTPGPRPQQWLSMGFQSCRLPARKPSKTLQNPPNPPNTVPSRHPRAKATSRTGTPGPRPQQWLSMGFQSCRLPARKRSKPSKTFQTLQTLQNLPNPPNTVPSRRPRAKATAMAFYIGFQSCRLPARKPSKTLQNPPNPPNTVPSRRPRAKATAMAFYRLSKLPFASPQTLQNPPKPPNTVPSRHPRAKATSRTGTPGPRPQQWLSIGFQSCRLPARKPSKTLQTLQTPSPAGTPRPTPLPEQAPQGQGHSNGFLWAFKAAVCQPANVPNLPKPSKPSKPSKTFQTLQTPSPAGAPGPRPQQWLSIGFQSCRLPARKPSKTLQTLQTPSQQAPQGQGHFPNRHPRAKATAMGFYRLSKLPFASPQTLQNPPNPPNTVPSRHPRAKATSRTGTPGPRPQQWLSMGFQSCRYGLSKLPFAHPQTLQTFQNLPNPPNPPKPSKPSKHRPQQAPQGQGHFPNRHPRAKATAMAFYGLSKLPFASPQTLQNPPNPPNTVPSRHPRAKATSRTGTPGPRPQQWLFIGFQSCRLPARKPSKPSKTLQSLQTLQNPPNPPNTFQNPPNPPKPSKPSKHLPQQAPQCQGHFSNRHPRAKATAMAFYGLSKLPFASPQTLQNPPNPPNTVPSRHPRAKATSRTGTPGPRPLRSPQLAFGPSD